MRVVLASTSSYRAALLQRLGVAFDAIAPGVDEQRLAGEAPAALCRRLSAAKAAAVSGRAPDALVIGSDQVLALGSSVLGKPGTPDAARAQLRRMSGRTARFLTGLHVHCPDGRRYDMVVPYAVRMRQLDDALIDAYLAFDEPWDCAGSFKSESAGVVLFAAQHGDDPTALVGLPLQRLAVILRAEGVRLLSAPRVALPRVELPRPAPSGDAAAQGRSRAQ